MVQVKSKTKPPVITELNVPRTLNHITPFSKPNAVVRLGVFEALATCGQVAGASYHRTQHMVARNAGKASHWRRAD